MGEVITVHMANTMVRQYKYGTSLLDIAQEWQAAYKTPIVAAKVNNEIKGLQFSLVEDCHLEFIEMASEPGIKVYQRSLTFVMVAAVREVLPEGEVTVEHSLSKGLYCELHLGREATEADIVNIAQRMSQMVEANIPLVRHSYPLEEAVRLFEATGKQEKVKLLRQLKKDTVSIYYCGDVYDYMYGVLVPNTSYLRIFELKRWEAGFILRFPEKEQPSELPEFNGQHKLCKVFREAEQWAKILGCDYVASLNEQAQQGNADNIIRIAEALHEKKVAQIADRIVENIEDTRVILVAGPSSSGKTTFAQRLTIQLRVNGVRPVPISVDDYFVDRASTPRDQYGNYDFETIEAIDLNLFNEHLSKLLNGEEVEVPSYNFTTGRREYKGHAIKIERGQPLIIEGIHGLNERLTQSVPKQQKIKIYISALTQLSIDSHNRIPTTDTRLLRRIVRDSQFRGHDALATLKLWPSVRRGEDQNIFPFQEEADIMFNSALIYELGVLKLYAEPLLREVSKEHPEYAEARRLISFLAYFEIIPDAEVVSNSILREFIGKSCFYR